MIYLDNAATSFPKPPSVVEETARCMKEYCGNAGRGAHALAMASAEKIYECRAELADFLDLDAPERIIFTLNTTYALNMALNGVFSNGDHILISELEHNAVYRTVMRLAEEQGVLFDVFPVVGLSHAELLAGIEQRIQSHTVALVTLHASNVCSLALPLKEIGGLCRRHGLYFIVDAAQSAGHLPIDMKAFGIDALALPAHKGLLGMQGLGVLALSARFSPAPLAVGGSGLASHEPHMPNTPPERFEAGTLPTPAIAGLLAGVRFLRAAGLHTVGAHIEALYEGARDRLQGLPDITLYVPEYAGSVLLFNHRALPPTEVARRLDRAGICVRAGLHCAPLAHRALGTPTGGAVRVSFGIFNTASDIEALYLACRDLM